MVLLWAAEEGWNPGRADAAVFWATDPNGFLIAEHDDEPVGAISAVRYGAEFGVIGLYLVRRDLRGQGIGHALWLAAMARLAGRTIAIDSAEAQAGNCAEWGFERAYRHVRHEIEASRIAGAVPDDMLDARATPPEELRRLDRACFPAPRAGFLQRWIAPPHRGLVTEREGEPHAFGVARPCRTGHKVGPLVARDAESARTILGALAAPLGDEAIYLDVPEASRTAMELVADLGMRPISACVRMYSGTPPPLQLERVYGVTTLELG